MLGVAIAPQRRSPGLMRRRLIAALIQWRNASGMSVDDAGKLINRTGPVVSRMETNQTQKIRPEFVSRLLSGYGAPDEVVSEQVNNAINLALAGKPAPGWYEEYGGPPAQFFGTYLDLEKDASSIDMWQPALWPGIAHTDDYARNVIGSMDDVPRDEVERRVRLRLARRQMILNRDDPPRLRIVVDESVLTRAVGGPNVLHAQLLHVAELAAKPGITVQVLPRSVGAHPGNFGGSITALGFGDPADTVIYLENYTGGTYLDLPEQTGAYLSILDAVRKLAKDEDESREMLAAAAAAA